MTAEHYQAIAKALLDLRFIQSFSLTSLCLGDKANKSAKDYMNKLAVLQQLCEQEALK